MIKTPVQTRFTASLEFRFSASKVSKDKARVVSRFLLSGISTDKVLGVVSLRYVFNYITIPTKGCPLLMFLVN